MTLFADDVEQLLYYVQTYSIIMLKSIVNDDLHEAITRFIDWSDKWHMRIANEKLPGITYVYN